MCADKMSASVCHTCTSFSVKLSALLVIASALCCFIHRLDPFLPVTTRALSWKLGYFMLVYSLSEAVNLPQHTREYACLVLKIKHTHNPCPEKEKQLILLVTQLCDRRPDFVKLAPAFQVTSIYNDV